MKYTYNVVNVRDIDFNILSDYTPKSYDDKVKIISLGGKMKIIIPDDGTNECTTEDLNKILEKYNKKLIDNYCGEEEPKKRKKYIIRDYNYSQFVSLTVEQIRFLTWLGENSWLREEANWESLGEVEFKEI